MVIVKRTRCANALLPMTKYPFECDFDRNSFRAPIFKRQGINRAGHVGITTIRRKHRSAHEQRTHRTRKRRQPVERALPCNTFIRKRPHLSIDTQYRAQQRRSVSVYEIGASRELDGGPCPPIQNAEAKDGPIGRMDAWQGKPVIAGELPRQGGDLLDGHGVLSIR